MFEERLKKLRLSRGLSQSEVAEQLDIKLRTYISYESNQREPNSEILKKLAIFFGVSADFLLGITVGIQVKGNKIENADSCYSDKENVIIKSYRNNPDMQLAVDKLLDIDIKKD